MASYRIAVIPGDGIGTEVVPEGIRVLEAAGSKYGVSFEFDELPLELRGLRPDRADDARGRSR